MFYFCIIMKKMEYDQIYGFCFSETGFFLLFFLWFTTPPLPRANVISKIKSD